jgi:hypothetical protein
VVDTAGQNPDPIDCGFTGMVLDHTGANMYVLYSDDKNEGPDYLLNCKVASGQLNFVAATAALGPNSNASNEYHVPTLSSNNEYDDGIDGANHGFAVWQRASNGTLTVPQNFTTKGGPVGWAPDVEYYVGAYGAKADPSSHLAVLMNYEAGPPFGIVGNPQIAAYTITSTGSLTTTSTSTKHAVCGCGRLLRHEHVAVGQGAASCRQRPRGRSLQRREPGHHLWLGIPASPIPVALGLQRGQNIC